MKYWEPLLDGQFANRAANVLQLIEAKILKGLNEAQDIYLHNGLTGQLLFLNEYSGQDGVIEEYTDLILGEVAASTKMDGTLMNGLTGIGYLLQRVHKRHQLLSDELLADLNGYLRKMVPAYIRHNDFDYLHGYLGICRFLLDADHHDEVDAIMQKAVVNLKNIATPQPSGIGWINERTLWMQYRDAKDLSEVSKDCNLGMAHGLPGIIYVLACMKTRYPSPEVANLLELSMQSLFLEESCRNKEEHGLYYSSFSGILGTIYTGQFGWCYSDLGIAVMLYNLYDLTGDPSVLERADKLAHSCAAKRMENITVNSSGLCHGAAGIAHLFNLMWQVRKAPEFKEAALYWYAVLFDQFMETDSVEQVIRFFNRNGKSGEKQTTGNGFLEGVSGIGLCIHAATSSQYPDWGKILLI